MFCPPGKNCRTPTGTIIKDGEMVPVDDMVCLCSVEGYTTDWRMAGPEDAPDAFCVPANRSTCLGPDGIVMQPGDIWTSPDGCQNCQCHFGEKYATCMLPSCTPPNCVNPRRVRGECCESCPNGKGYTRLKGKVRPALEVRGYTRLKSKVRPGLTVRRYTCSRYTCSRGKGIYTSEG